jgi:hypothetical protein
LDLNQRFMNRHLVLALLYLPRATPQTTQVSSECVAILGIGAFQRGEGTKSSRGVAIWILHISVPFVPDIEMPLLTVIAVLGFGLR